MTGQQRILELPLLQCQEPLSRSFTCTAEDNIRDPLTRNNRLLSFLRIRQIRTEIAKLLFRRHPPNLPLEPLDKRDAIPRRSATQVSISLHSSKQEQHLHLSSQTPLPSPLPILDSRPSLTPTFPTLAKGIQGSNYTSFDGEFVCATKHCRQENEEEAEESGYKERD